MLEIDNHSRLVHHNKGAGGRWQLQQRLHQPHSSRRAIWLPQPPLMNSEQTLAWLRQHTTNPLLINAFRHAAGLD